MAKFAFSSEEENTETREWEGEFREVKMTCNFLKNLRK